MKDQNYYQRAYALLGWALEKIGRGTNHNYNRIRKLCDICIQGQNLGLL